ncbi:hypothetical protein LZ578_11005 [Jeotgalibaca sp. MA1X17-3]|uniref:hypothetical protein n=1 Tax=Jeotgalibaca sp. MA1X17-3 TaxID=2908211 RepID=UPI001F207D05|nr:hypothetical protein [Jeotgalibaca sp. MA1X17-3]UJF15481.1 hypothetical protein LZ578_11005 [Jeotgalibaca sp. MA1X17-3]
MHIAKWEWKKLLRDWKTRILALAFLLFFGSFSLLYQQQTVAFPQERMAQEYEDIHSLFNMLPQSAFTDDIGDEVYDLLAEQQMLYGLQLYILKKKLGNTVPNWEKILSNYLDNGTKIATNQSRLLELKEFDHFNFLRQYLPEEERITQELALYKYLEEHDLDIEWNSYSASNILLQEVNLIIGFSLFLFIALLGSDRFTKDQTKNWSISQGVPVTLRKQWHIRTFHTWVVVWSVSLIGLLISYLISLIQETSGSLLYPVMVYTSSGYKPIAIWQYTFLALGIAMLLSYFLLLLTIGLSWVFRTTYLTIILVLGVYFFPFIWNFIPSFSSWQPSLYLHLQSIFSGEMAMQLQMPGITFEKAWIGILLLILFVEVLFTFLFDQIQTQTLGLQRRISS